MTRYHRCCQALRDFLTLKISFSDYCDILNDNEVTVGGGFTTHGALSRKLSLREVTLVRFPDLNS